MSFDRDETRILALTGLGHFGAHFAMLAWPTAALFVADDLGLPREQVLEWSFAGYLLFGLGAMPAGLLADRLRARWMVRLSVLGIGPALASVALAPGRTGTVLALVLVGAFASLYHPAGMGLISRTVRARGTALGINGIFGASGIAAAPLATELAIQALGWRGAFVALGVGLLVLGMAASTLAIDEPAPGDRPAGDDAHGDAERLRLFAILLVAMTIGGLAYRATTVALPAFLDDRGVGVGPGKAAFFAFLFGTFGQLAGGRLADRHDLRHVYLAFYALSVPCVGAMIAATGPAALGASAAFVFFNLGMQPVENSLVARFTPDRWRSTGFGFKFAVVFGVGATSVKAVRALMATHGTGAVFVGVAALATAVTAVAAWLAWHTRGQSMRHGPA